MIERSAFAGAVPVTFTTFVEELEQPPVVTVTPSVTEPEAGAENVIEDVPLPAVIVPPVIDQEYVDEGDEVATEALLPVEFALTDVGAVIVEFGTAFTAIVCEADAEQPLPSVTVTLYVVVAVGATEIVAVVAPVDQR